MTGFAANITKPTDDQTLEDLSCKLFGAVLNDKVLGEGRRGQKQAGVDTWGYKDGNESYIVGIQCKVRTGNHLSKKHVFDEVEAARLFKPHLNDYYIITTADGDSKLDTLAREINQGIGIEKPPFRVFILGWREITKLIVEHELETVFDPAFSPIMQAVRSHIAAQTVILDLIQKDLEKPRKPIRRCNHIHPIPIQRDKLFHHGINGLPRPHQVPFYLPASVPLMYFHAHPLGNTAQRSLSNMALALGDNFSLVTPSGDADIPIRLSDFIMCATTTITERGRRIDDATLFFRDGEVCAISDCTNYIDLARTIRAFFAAVQFASEIWQTDFDVSTGFNSRENTLISFKVGYDKIIKINTGIFPIYSRTFSFSDNRLSLEAFTDLIEGAGIHLEKGTLYKTIKNAVHNLPVTTTFDDIYF